MDFIIYELVEGCSYRLCRLCYYPLALLLQSLREKERQRERKKDRERNIEKQRKRERKKKGNRKNEKRTKERNKQTNNQTISCIVVRGMERGFEVNTNDVPLQAKYTTAHAHKHSGALVGVKILKNAITFGPWYNVKIEPTFGSNSRRRG